MAGAVNLPLTLERDVAERAVEGGQGQVAERVHENLVNLVRILAQAGEMLTPLLAQRLRQYMLDRQAGSLKVDELRVPIALLKSFEDYLPLRPPPADVERAGPDRLTELLVTRPVATLPREF